MSKSPAGMEDRSPFSHEALPSSLHLCVIQLFNVDLFLYVKVKAKEPPEFLQVMFG